MAKDLLLGNVDRCWDRGRRDNEVGEKTVVIQDRGFPWVGTAIGLTLATRIFTGKWPWYWFKNKAER